jgi:hypothetical protein
MEACQRTIFGGSIQRDALTVQGITAGDTVETLFCVTGDESFEDDRTGRKQSLGCSRFFRVEK